MPVLCVRIVAVNDDSFEAVALVFCNPNTAIRILFGLAQKIANEFLMLSR